MSRSNKAPHPCSKKTHGRPHVGHGACHPLALRATIKERHHGHRIERQAYDEALEAALWDLYALYDMDEIYDDDDREEYLAWKDRAQGEYNEWIRSPKKTSGSK